jgi:hypothetical protein
VVAVEQVEFLVVAAAAGLVDITLTQHRAAQVLRLLLVVVALLVVLMELQSLVAGHKVLLMEHCLRVEGLHLRLVRIIQLAGQEAQYQDFLLVHLEVLVVIVALLVLREVLAHMAVVAVVDIATQPQELLAGLEAQTQTATAAAVEVAVDITLAEEMAGLVAQKAAVEAAAVPRAQLLRLELEALLEEVRFARHLLLAVQDVHLFQLLVEQEEVLLE